MKPKLLSGTAGFNKKYKTPKRSIETRVESLERKVKKLTAWHSSLECRGSAGLRAMGIV